MSRSDSHYVYLAYKRASFDHMENDGKEVYEVYRLADGTVLKKRLPKVYSDYEQVIDSIETRQDKALSPKENMDKKLKNGIITQEIYDNWYQRYSSYQQKDVVSKPIKELQKK